MTIRRYDSKGNPTRCSPLIEVKGSLLSVMFEDSVYVMFEVFVGEDQEFICITPRGGRIEIE